MNEKPMHPRLWPAVFLLVLGSLWQSGCSDLPDWLGLGSGLALHLDVAVDVSAADDLREHLSLDSAFVAELVRRLPVRSAMHVYAIHAAAEWQEPILRAEMPKTPGIAYAAVDSAHHRYLREIARVWPAMARKAVAEGYQYESDIVGVLNVLAEHQRDQKAHRKVIVLLSDMQDVRKGEWNFEKQTPPIGLLKQWRQEGLIPNLSGTDVYVFRFWPAHGVAPGRYRAIRRFWEVFFDSSGANLRAFRAQREPDLVLKPFRRPFEVEKP